MKNSEEDGIADRIKVIKEKYISTSEIKKVKGVSKKEIEDFYKSQMENNE